MTDITELALITKIKKQLKNFDTVVLKEGEALALVEALEKAQQRIEELESDLSEWTDCKHDGATYYDMSGRERCGRCGADL
ncbi:MULTISPECIES: hypothetical protein [unclassified Raoultella]|uniref:hypothetical protein n=1 Tax=unclassified Raoultella TaxID=2627600 RepID=UPI00135BAC1A|nr:MULTISPECIES: hypothetical protein [unclassified Raoultella]